MIDEDVQDIIRTALHHIYIMRRATTLITDATTEEVDKFIADVAREELVNAQEMSADEIALDTFQEAFSKAEKRPTTKE